MCVCIIMCGSHASCKPLFSILVYQYPHKVSLHCFPEIMIGFEHTSYTVNEDDRRSRVEVCAEFTGTSSGCSVDFPFEVAIQTVDDTAGIL